MYGTHMFFAGLFFLQNQENIPFLLRNNRLDFTTESSLSKVNKTVAFPEEKRRRNILS
jgi:hypothetical protein